MEERKKQSYSQNADDEVGNGARVARGLAAHAADLGPRSIVMSIVRRVTEVATEVAWARASHGARLGGRGDPRFPVERMHNQAAREQWAEPSESRGPLD